MINLRLKLYVIFGIKIININNNNNINPDFINTIEVFISHLTVTYITVLLPLILFKSLSISSQCMYNIIRFSA